jgi:hypothetical protein
VTNDDASSWEPFRSDGAGRDGDEECIIIEVLCSFNQIDSTRNHKEQKNKIK